MKKKGFTLLELMIAILIIIVGITGLLAGERASYRIAERARNTSLAIGEAQEQLEVIYDTVFVNISALDQQTFEVAGMSNTADAEGVIRVFNNGLDPDALSNTNLLWVSVTVCWREAENRIIGEDTNLDGSLDVGEDTNANNLIDSPVQLITLIGRR